MNSVRIYANRNVFELKYESWEDASAVKDLIVEALKFRERDYVEVSSHKQGEIFLELDTIYQVAAIKEGQDVDY